MEVENVQNDFTYFSEHDETKRILAEISVLSNLILWNENHKGRLSDSAKEEKLDLLISKITQISEIVSKYMDNDVLLYQYIHTLIGDIFDILKRFTLLPSIAKLDIITRIECKKSASLIVLEKLSFYLYIISKCVGIRRLINYAPNDVTLFEKITETIEIIQNTNDETSETPINKHEDHLWCLEFVFLSWESLMVYTPFDLNTIWKHPSDRKITFQTRILTCTMHYLSKATKARDGAAMVISNLFSRKDVINSEDFQYFLKFCQDILTNPVYNMNYFNKDVELDYILASDPSKKVNNHLSIGILMVLKQIIKRVSTTDLEPYLDILEFCLLNCDNIIVNSATKKLRSSCLGRLAMHMLPPQNNSQKYRRKYRTIFGKENSEEKDEYKVADSDFSMEVSNTFDTERVEIILAKILESLPDTDIRVRWACAKSIGRISSRLPIQLNEEILDHIIELINSQFARTINHENTQGLDIYSNGINGITTPKVVVQPISAQSESVVHGGCLAIAEILREGLIHPHMLDKVLDTTILTLSFEVWRGKGSAGTAVRDASCFICWAIARTFTKEMLSQAHVSRISMELVNVSIFDSSLNCRRASCAALQELVGRLGTVPKGLELIQMCNYYTISNRKKAFVEVCQQVASLCYYSNSMLQNVIGTKLFHPDMSTRELSSLAIYKILSSTPHLSHSYFNTYQYNQKENGSITNNIKSKQNIEFLITYLIDYFINNLYTPSGATTQGALRAMARLLYFVIDRNLPVNYIFYKVLNIPVSFEKKRLFRTKGSNIIRQAICKLITVNCKLIIQTNAHNTYNSDEDADKIKEIIDYYIVILKDCLRNFGIEVQLASVEAFEQLFFIVKDTPISENLFKYFVDSLSSKNDHISVRRGQALVFSSIPLNITRNTSNGETTDHSYKTVENVTNQMILLLCDEIKTNIEFESIRDSKTRQFALLSILSILNRLNGYELETKILEKLTETLVLCCNDYEIDSRGDVGSWVRELSSEVIIYILNQHLFMNKSRDSSYKNSFKNLSKKLATDLSVSIVGLTLENLEHVRSRSTFLFCHLLTNKLSKFSFRWVWNRIFYNMPYEQLIASDPGIPIGYKDCSSTSSTMTPDSAATNMDEDSDKDADYEVKVYISNDHEMNIYTNIDNKLLEGFNMLFDISKNLIQDLSTHYDNIMEIETEYDFELTKGYKVEYHENKGLIPVKDSENSLEKPLKDSEKLNVALRIPGWSAAPLTFKTLLWVLLIPSYTKVAFKSIVRTIGENSKLEVKTHSDNKILVLEDVFVDFISENKDTFISWKEGLKPLEMVIRDCCSEIYQESRKNRDSKTSQKLVNTLKLLFSHRLLDVNEWYEVIRMMFRESKKTTNYAYIKSIINCLQVLIMDVNVEFSSEISQNLLHLLNHQYPTIRSYVASHLTLALSTREGDDNEKAIEILESCPFHLKDEKTISNEIKKLTTLITI